MNSGIYKIVNEKTGQFYIGSAVNLKKRIYNHYIMLKNGNHSNIHLRRSAKKHGHDSFSISIIEECSITNLRKIEQKYLDESVGTSKCYNIATDAFCPMLGRKASPETNKKRSDALRGKPLSEEHKQKISKSNLGKKMSDSSRIKMSLSHIGKKLPEEQKRKIGLAQAGEHSSNAKLTTKQVIQIRQLYAQGNISSRQLAKKYNVKDKATILNIIHFRSWKHIN